MLHAPALSAWRRNFYKAPDSNSSENKEHSCRFGFQFKLRRRSKQLDLLSVVKYFLLIIITSHHACEQSTAREIKLGSTLVLRVFIFFDNGSICHFPLFFCHKSLSIDVHKMNKTFKKVRRRSDSKTHFSFVVACFQTLLLDQAIRRRRLHWKCLKP